MDRRGAFGAAPLVLILGLVLVQQVPGALVQSATFDEVYKVSTGYSLLRTGKMLWTWDHPPLIRQLVALPLLLLSPQMPQDVDNKGDFAHRFFFHNTVNPDMMLFLARLPIIGLTLTLVWCVYSWARKLWGHRSGLLAAFVAALDPNIIAHGQLATNDLGLTCFFFLAVYALWRFFQHQAREWLFAAGLATGLALASKFSAIVLVPILLGLGAIYLVSRMSDDAQKYGRRMLGWLLLILVIALVVLVVDYGGEFCSVWALAVRLQSVGRVEVAPPDAGPFVDFILTQVPIPAPSYWYGLWLVRQDVQEGGRPAFLWGQRSETGWWYYFPAAFLIKTPLSVQILLGVAVAMLVKTWSRSWYDFLFLALPAGTWLGLAMFSRLNLGYRYVLPILPFLFVMVGRVAGAPLPGWRRAVVLALMGWLTLSAVMIFPYHLTYFNELVGGPEEGYRYLVDSNLDWGQDLKRLARYQRERGVGKLHLAYFGTADPDYYGIEYACMPSLGLLACEDAPIPRRGTLAVSATCLQGGCTQDPLVYRWLLGETPVAKIGYSIFVYDLSGED